MKVICPRKHLYEAVQVVGRAVSSKSSLPILSHFLLAAEDGKLSVMATDLELGMQCIIDAKIEKTGRCTAPAKILAEILAALPESEVVLESQDEDSSVLVKCGMSEYSILSLPAEEFPMLPDVMPETHLVIERHILRQAVTRTAFAISDDESRPILTGLLMEIFDGCLNFVSTDTHRLCLQEVAVVSCEGQDKNAIAPGRAVSELTRLVPESEGTVSVSISGNQIMFEVEVINDSDPQRVEKRIFISRLIEGQFPNYRRVIPSEFKYKLVAPTTQFSHAVKRTSIVARENAFRTSLHIKDGMMTLSAKSAKVGAVKEEFEIIYDGDEFDIVFNCKYLTDVLNALDCEAVEIELNGEMNPGVIRPQGQFDYTYVIMPMQKD